MRRVSFWLAASILATGGVALAISRLSSGGMAVAVAVLVAGAVAIAIGVAAWADRTVHLNIGHRRTLDRLHDASSESLRLEAALRETSDAVLIIEGTGGVAFANQTARSILHGPTIDVSRQLGQPDLERLVERASTTREVLAEDVTLWVPGARPARARAVPMADGTTILLLSDLSESYRLDRVRRDFVANVSHELKTPVAAIRALAETAATALGSDDLDTATRFVERLGVESARLAGLVSDLLDLSRVEAGADLILSTIDIDQLLAEAADRARSIAEVKELELVLQRSGIRVQGDPAQLGMAIKNLVDNAVRYSEHGKIELTAEKRGRTVAIAVADQGIGIPSDELTRVFERFYRVDKARSRSSGGTGLGLAIVRHVAENHGGSVEVTSELGTGSTFTLTLPGRATEGWSP
jgi:two-component system sensor histidine kinase SenX3